MITIGSNCVNAWDGERYINDEGNFIAVEYDGYDAENPRDWECNIAHLFTWDCGNYYCVGSAIESPDDAPSMLDIIEPFYNSKWLDRKYDRYAEGKEYDKRYEWLFELIENGTNICRLPEFIVALNKKRGVKAWPLIRNYYGNEGPYIDIDDDLSIESLEYLERVNDLIGVAVIYMDEFHENCCKSVKPYDVAKNEVNTYAAYQRGSCHYVTIHDGIDYEGTTLYGEVDGSVDLDYGDFGDLTEVDFDEHEWWDMVEEIKSIAFPFVGYVSDERAKKALAALVEQRYDIPSVGDFGWSVMMKAIIENAA